MIASRLAGSSAVLRKLLWFVGLYIVSVLVVAGVAYGLRALLIR